MGLFRLMAYCQTGQGPFGLAHLLVIRPTGQRPFDLADLLVIRQIVLDQNYQAGQGSFRQKQRLLQRVQHLALELVLRLPERRLYQLAHLLVCR
jgi:hypothetical protein